MSLSALNPRRVMLNAQRGGITPIGSLPLIVKPPSTTKLHRLASTFTRGLLGKKRPHGNCFVVSYPLMGYLSFLGIETKLVQGWVDCNAPEHAHNRRNNLHSHYWLALSDGRIIDPTASQFNDRCGRRMRKVYVGPCPEWYHEDEG